MVSTLTQAIEKCKKPVAKAGHDAKVTELRQKILEMLNQPLFPIEQDQVYETLNQAVKCFFCYKLSQQYPIISKSIFELVTKKEEVIGRYLSELALPSVLGLPLNRIQEKSEFRTTIYAKPKNDEYDTKRVEIWCPIPRITSEARTAMAESVAYRAQIIAEAYRDSLFAKILEKDMVKDAPENITNQFLDAEFQLIWAPSEWNVKYVEKDPAVLINYDNANFLVHQWEIPEEKSLDAMLREFSEDFEPSGRYESR